MLKAVLYGGAVVLGLALGLGSARLAVTGFGSGGVSNGVWSTDLSIGGTEAGLYTRASVAVNGLLALKGSETIYFSATRDANGSALSSNCSYILEGKDPAARWWSVTVYGSDGFLLPEANGKYSVSKSNVARTGGNFQIALTRDGSGPNGIPTGSGDFTLTLRLYNPDASVAAAPDKAALPQLKTGACQ